MKKAAFFVEGQTEMLLVHRLLHEMAGAKKLAIHACKARGSHSARKREFQAESGSSGDEFYALVVDCGADSAVVSDVRDNYDFLIKAGFSFIIGLRDVYPCDRADIPVMQKAQCYKMRTQPVCPQLILAIMEVECWFIGEHTHFQRIDPALNHEAIIAACAFDPSTCDPQDRDNPAADLHSIYSLAGKAYRKRRGHVQRTLDALSYEELCLSVSVRVPALGALVGAIDVFLA